jgi:hypothetical protein
VWGCARSSHWVSNPSRCRECRYEDTPPAVGPCPQRNAFTTRECVCSVLQPAWWLALQLRPTPRVTRRPPEDSRKRRVSPKELFLFAESSLRRAGRWRTQREADVRAEEVVQQMDGTTLDGRRIKVSIPNKTNVSVPNDTRGSNAPFTPRCASLP